MDQLYNLQPQRRGTDWELAFRFLRSRLRRMSIVFLLSDFITDPERPALSELPDVKVLAQKHDLVPVIFGDRIESELPTGRGLLRFRSAESGQEMVLSLSSAQRRRFDSFVSGRRDDLQSFFYSLGMECLFLKVGEPFMDPIMTLFQRRRKV